METNQGKFRKTLLATSISSCLLASAYVSAQEEPMIEEVVVTGIRASLTDAVDIKRNSTAVVDAVSAEDVGKFPDADLGESLARVPGVSVGRAFGQGASVSIRGAAPQLTLTQLNGQDVASTGWYDQVNIDRSFNYSLMPSEVISGMEVYKSTQANLNEGGIGGTVIVKTRKPLDMDANTTFLGVKGSVGTISDEVAPNVTGLYSWKNDSETFGILGSIVYSDNEYVRQGDETDLTWGASAVPSRFVQQRERTTSNIAVQFAPTDELQFGLNYMSLELVGDNTATSLYLFDNAPGSCTEYNASNVCVKRTIAEGEGIREFGQTWARQGTMDSDTFTLDGSYEGDNFRVSAVVGSTKAEGGTDLTTNFGYVPLDSDGNEFKYVGNVDATGDHIELSGPKSVITVADLVRGAATSAPASWAVGKGPNSDEEVYGQIDVEIDLDLGAINKFEFGVRTTDHDVEKSDFKSVLKATAVSVPTESLYSGSEDLGFTGAASFPVPDGDAMAAITRKNLDRWQEARSGYATINEQNDAIYGMFSFETEGVRGNFGLRYIHTDASSKFYAIDGTPLAEGDFAGNEYYSTTLSENTASYHDVLPSVNVSFDLSDQLVLRLAAGQAISRANYQDMFASSSQSGYSDTVQGNETLTTGSIGLLPVKSSQADLGLEYYYGDGNLFSATYFVKDLNNFVVSDIKQNQSIGLVSPDTGEDNWTVSDQVNAGGGTIDGIELQWNHAFDNGFGTNLNYTFTDAKAPSEVYADQQSIFTESSKHNANAVVYWENDVFSARAAYNWRSKYMIRDGAFYYGNRMHDAYGQLDLSFNWYATDIITLSFDASNVTEEDDLQYGVAPASSGLKPELLDTYPAWTFKGEATYTLGASVKF
ncbi:TonB-dependent receptor [Gilvimarinus japonicus]|uniref:TonB-dependent receptor n=1 Tax=Gilvimarinus japonicus TaxID=1796469 RepID=A0ABV7HXL0_9GAMM